MSAYAKVLPIIASVIEDSPISDRLLGIHLEGPFISPVPGAIGCHRTECVVPADLKMLKELVTLARGNIKLLTMAAEWPASPEVCKWAVSEGIVVSMGHHVASSAQIHDLADCGATLLTHLGNGLPNELNRHHNPIWPSLSDHRLTAMLITDGFHLPPDSICSFIRAKGIANTIITSDVVPVAGQPTGIYEFAGMKVKVEGNSVKSADRPCLAGSGAVMLDCINHFLDLFLSQNSLRYANSPLTPDQVLRDAE